MKKFFAVTALVVSLTACGADAVDSDYSDNPPVSDSGVDVSDYDGRVFYMNVKTDDGLVPCIIYNAYGDGGGAISCNWPSPTVTP